MRFPRLEASLVAVPVATLAILAACADESAAPREENVRPMLDASLAEAAPLAPSNLCSTLTRSGEVVWELHLAGSPPTPVGGVPSPGTYDLVELYSFGEGAKPAERSPRATAADDAGEDAAAGSDEDGGSVDPDGGSPDGSVDADAGDPDDPGMGDETPHPSPVTGRTLQATVIVKNDTLRKSELSGSTAGDGGTELANVSFFKIDGTSLVLRSVCPAVGAEARVSYTATANGLMLLVDGTHTEVYARRP